MCRCVVLYCIVLYCIALHCIVHVCMHFMFETLTSQYPPSSIMGLHPPIQSKARGAGTPTHWQSVATLHFRYFPHSLPDHQGAHRSQRQLPLYLSPSHPAPSPLVVLPLYLPPCAPSHPIKIVEGPYLGEGVMIIAS